MAALTNREIVTTKRSFAIMARHTALSPSRGVMIEWCRRRHLSALRHAWPSLMACVTGFLLMLSVTKADSKSLRETECA
jgi:hypothetical protein